MMFSQHDSIDPNAALDRIDAYIDGAAAPRGTDHPDIHILSEKLQIPDSDPYLQRPRLYGLLQKSQAQYPATLISGRAGTGKTALAASFAAQCDIVSWFTVESTDIEWVQFSQYFSASLLNSNYKAPVEGLTNGQNADVSEDEIALFLLRQFMLQEQGRPSLIVLDDIHHVFDTAWFGDFFRLLLYSLPSRAHLLLLCRSKPLNPLWRLRSKQMLNVIDEKVIAFTLAETEALFAGRGLSPAEAARAHQRSFGRISRLIQFANDAVRTTPDP